MQELVAGQLLNMSELAIGSEIYEAIRELASTDSLIGHIVGGTAKIVRWPYDGRNGGPAISPLKENVLRQAIHGHSQPALRSGYLSACLCLAIDGSLLPIRKIAALEIDSPLAKRTLQACRQTGEISRDTLTMLFHEASSS
ncbi:hypothetical protein [Paraburkholderia sp. BR13444]|uniref:hypothetical protein n=1 Tax=Paraburkholderia sp. BR13444 TaxID=3236997 RepID=UPI0034CFA7DC